MVYTTTTQHPSNSQYDSDSAPNQPYNCGPTTVTNSVKFMVDKDYGIEATRNLVTSRNGNGTTTSERKAMFGKRGVPADVLHLSVSEVRAKLNGKKTFDMALLMSKIPLSIRKRPFSGSHSVEAIAKGIKDGQSGIWVNNPDFHRDRGEPSRYFYPDAYWIRAYQALGGWCVVPRRDKVISTRTAYVRRLQTASSVNARSGPSTGHSVVRILAAGYAFTSIQRETAGGTYVAGGATRRDWVSFNLNGRLVWVAQGHTKGV